MALSKSFRDDPHGNHSFSVIWMAESYTDRFVTQVYVAVGTAPTVQYDTSNAA